MDIDVDDVIAFLDRVRTISPDALAECEGNMTAAIDDLLYLKQCGFDFDSEI